MSKPTDIITWATDAAYAVDGDAWGGDANKVDPGATRRAEGAEPDTFPSVWFNHILNAIGNVLTWLMSMWTKDGEHLFPASFARYTLIPLTSGFDISRGIVPGWLGRARVSGLEETEVLRSTVDSGLVGFSLNRFVPHGATITAVRVVVQPGAASRGSGQEMKISLHKSTLDWATATLTGSTIVSRVAADTITTQVVSINGLITEMNNQVLLAGVPWSTGVSEELILMVQAGNDGGAHNPDTLLGVQVAWTDVGLSNQ